METQQLKNGLIGKGEIRSDSFNRKDDSRFAVGELKIEHSENFYEPGYFIIEKGTSFQIFPESFKLLDNPLGDALDDHVKKFKKDFVISHILMIPVGRLEELIKLFIEKGYDLSSEKDFKLIKRDFFNKIDQEEKPEVIFKVGERVVNGDSYVGEVIEVGVNIIKMRFEKCGKIKEESWDKDHVRHASDSEDGI